MNIKDTRIFNEYVKIIANMYRLGWDERNGGNVSVIVDEKELKDVDNVKEVIRTFNTEFDMTEIIGKYFFVTGTGRYFKNVECNPEENIGLVRVKSKDTLELLWGFSTGGAPTSELPSHFMSHIERLKVDPEHHVVMHTHPTNLIAMTFVHTLDERAFTKTLWQMSTECLVVFPDGIGVLPWMLCGNGEIGVETAKKMKDLRLVIWSQHGIFGTGKTIDEAFGLIETAEKAAEIYLKICDKKILQTIKDDQLKELAEKFKLIPKAGYLDA